MLHRLFFRLCVRAGLLVIRFGCWFVNGSVLVHVGNVPEGAVKEWDGAFEDFAA